MYAPETQNSNGRGSTAQMWITSDQGDQVMQTSTRYCRISEYGPETGPYFAGKWHWSARSQTNPAQGTSGIAKDKAQAKETAERYAAMSDAELTEIAAQEPLKKLEEIGYQPRSSIEYSRGYEDGYKAAMEKLAEFLNLNLAKE
ncbi:MAG: hypothetical protein H3C26_12410 [Rhodocyclaceae bacterium]|nr:hypothetical protein [Rhodocyclaceae bacterium]